jgi:hypothetical protein
MIKKLSALTLAAVLATATYATKPAKAEQFCLYSQAKRGKCLQQLSLQQNWTKIISQGQWVKVGLRPSGQIGWINAQDYTAAKQAYVKDRFSPNFQTVYVNVQRDKNGKPVYNVVAYRNGKKLSDKQAKAMYQRFLKQQRNESLQMRRVNNSVQAFDQRFFSEMNDNIGPNQPINFWFGFPGDDQNLSGFSSNSF